MVTIDALMTAGYKEYKSSTGKTERFFQKWIVDGSGTRLFALNFFYWFSPLGHRDCFSAEARLYQTSPALSFDNETDFDLDLMIGSNATVESVEAFFSAAFTCLGCVPDPHN